MSAFPSPGPASAVPPLALGRLLLRDEGLLRVSLVDTATGRLAWQVPAPAGRDMQVLAGGRFLIGTDAGFEERSLVSGEPLRQETRWPGTVAAFRLRNGHTFLSRLAPESGSDIELIELGRDGALVRLTRYPGFSYVRLVRPTPGGTVLVTSNTRVFEGTADGKIVWQATIDGHHEPHAWQALRLPDGDTLVAAGYAASLQLFGPRGNLKARWTAPAEARPFFYSGFQRLRNGSLLVANWQGHGTDRGTLGAQVLLHSPGGEVLGGWIQPGGLFSSIQAVLAVDDAAPAAGH